MTYKVQPLAEQLKVYLGGRLVSGEKPERVIGEFVGVSREAIGRWRRGGGIAGGEVSAKLAGFLLAVGLMVTELSSRRELENLFKGLGLGVVSVDELLEKIQVPRDSFLRFLGGERQMSRDRMQGLYNLISSEAYQAKLAEKLKATERLRLVPVGPEVLVDTKPKINGLLTKQDLLQMAAAQVNILLPLASRIESDSFSDEERQELRRLVGSDGIFRLSNILARLCSKTARQQMVTLEKGGQ